MKSIFFCVLLLTILAACACADSAFVYGRTDGFWFRVTGAGLSDVGFGDRIIARGGWTAFPTNEKEIGPDEEVRWSVTPISTTSVKVRQRNKFTDTTFVYTFDGEDVVIKATVENRHPKETLPVMGFGSLKFLFNKAPDGLMLHSDGGDGAGVPWWMHPGHVDKIGGGWATDGTFGLGLTPLKTGFTRTQLYWTGDKSLCLTDAHAWKRPMKCYLWRTDTGSGPAAMILNYYAEKPIPPGGTDTFWLKMRFSRNTGWKHLLQPYKEHFLATFGPLHYKTDHRMFTQGALSDASWRTPGNPYGFQYSRRVDLPNGARAYASEQVRKLRAANGQGTLLWAYQGNEPRGSLYRTDFDVYPPSIGMNVPIMRSIYDKAGMHLGLTSRPGQFTYRKLYASDDVLSINGDDPTHLDSYVKRFRNALARGCTAFYLDSFGDSLDHVKAMKRYREMLGPNVHTFAEMHCDAVLPYSGIYTEATFNKDADPEHAYNIAWLDNTFFEVTRWMLGDMDSVVPVRDPGPGGAEYAYRWLYSHHLTPMCQDWDFGMEEDNLGKLQAQYIEQDGKWKK